MSLSLDFIASVDPSQPSGFRSMHGPTEVAGMSVVPRSLVLRSQRGDFFELCVNYYYPNVNQWYNFVTCMNQDRAAIPQPAQGCLQQAGLDWTRIASCATGPMGKKLLLASLTR
jgi:hypothetical protein